MKLSNQDIRSLRGLAHGLKPVVLVGQQGPTEALLTELEGALAHHQLIKIRLRAERDTRKAWTQAILDATGGLAVQTIGQILVLYRRNPDRPELAF